MRLYYAHSLRKLQYCNLQLCCVFRREIINSSYKNLVQWTNIICFGMECLVLLKNNQQIQNVVSKQPKVWAVWVYKRAGLDKVVSIKKICSGHLEEYV